MVLDWYCGWVYCIDKLPCMVDRSRCFCTVLYGLQMGHSENMRMKLPADERCQAINLRGIQCAKGATMGNLCVIHYEKNMRFRVELIR